MDELNLSEVVVERLTGLLQRATHTITEETTFPSSPGVVFHDSEGFESVSTLETDTVSKFVKECTPTGDFKKQLHAIW